MSLITKDFYKADIFRFDLEQDSNLFQFTINNSISWDIMQMRLTKNELKGLADFINNMIGEKND